MVIRSSDCAGGPQHVYRCPVPKTIHAEFDLGFPEIPFLDLLKSASSRNAKRRSFELPPVIAEAVLTFFHQPGPARCAKFDDHFRIVCIVPFEVIAAKVQGN